MQTNPDILSVSLDIGAAMLRCGADVHRVEDTVTRINRAYSDEPVEVFSISSLVLATRGHGTDGRTESRRVNGYSTDLARLEELNKLSRRICRELPSAQEAHAAFTEVVRPLSRRDQLLSCLGYFIGPFGMCVFFGGTLLDGLLSALIGLLLWLSDRKLRGHLPNQLVYTLLTAACMGLLASAATLVFPALNPDKVMIGDIMLQIPGLVLTNGLRDMLLGDTMTGSLRTLEAILTTFAIAFGFAIPMLIIPFDFGGSSQSIAVQILFPGIGTLGFSLFFRIHFKRLIPAAVSGMLTIAVYLFAFSKTGNALVSYMIAAIVAGAYAEIAARVLRAPVTVFLVPGLIPLLPGAGLFYTIASIVHSNSADFVRYGIGTVQAAVGIVIGVLFSSILFLLFHRRLHRKPTR